MTEQQAPNKGQSRHRGWWWLAGVLLVILLALGAAALWLQRMLFEPVTYATPIPVDVRPRATMSFLATRLQERGIIPSALALRIYARYTGQASKLKVGEYELSGKMRPVDVLALLISGRARAFWLTVPEGKWATEIDEIVAQHWPDAAPKFAALIAQPAHWQKKVSFPLHGETLEGYLYPDTYQFVKGASAEQIVAAMLGRFNDTCGKAYRAHPPRDGRSLYDVLVLASLVEYEAKVPSERARIAGVYMNRMRLHMLLQCDATLIYAQQTRLRRVLNKDKLVESPYNTYKYPGLPPGPINNPGLPSFEAALHPEETPYLYYVARGDGSHYFSRTLAEHNAAVRQYIGK